VVGEGETERVACATASAFRGLDTVTGEVLNTTRLAVRVGWLQGPRPTRNTTSAEAGSRWTGWKASGGADAPVTYPPHPAGAGGRHRTR
jgi:hypothetical protein